MILGLYGRTVGQNSFYCIRSEEVVEIVPGEGILDIIIITMDFYISREWYKVRVTICKIYVVE